jgi:hypothetical protein
MSRRSIGALSAIAYAVLDEPDKLDAMVEKVALQADLDVTLALRGARVVQDQLADALGRGR